MRPARCKGTALHLAHHSLSIQTLLLVIHPVELNTLNLPCNLPITLGIASQNFDFDKLLIYTHYFLAGIVIANLAMIIKNTSAQVLL